MLIKLPATLLTFLIGVCGVLVYWNVWLSPQLRSEVVAPLTVPTPIQTTLCEAAEQKNFFDGKLVSFEATAVVHYVGHSIDGRIFLYAENCYFQDDAKSFAVRLELDSYFGNASNLKALLEGGRKGSGKDYKKVDVKVTGTARIVTESDGYKMYSITPADIQIISAFR